MEECIEQVIARKRREGHPSTEELVEAQGDRPIGDARDLFGTILPRARS